MSGIEAGGYDKKMDDSLEYEAAELERRHWSRSASEHIIVCSRGKVPRPEDWPALPTWMPEGEVEGAPRAPHSVKPDVFYARAAAAVPSGNYLELFARRPRTGWSVWGNEVPCDVDIAANG